MFLTIGDDFFCLPYTNSAYGSDFPRISAFSRPLAFMIEITAVPSGILPSGRSPCMLSGSVDPFLLEFGSRGSTVPPLPPRPDPSESRLDPSGLVELLLPSGSKSLEPLGFTEPLLASSVELEPFLPSRSSFDPFLPSRGSSVDPFLLPYGSVEPLLSPGIP